MPRTPLGALSCALLLSACHGASSRPSEPRATSSAPVAGEHDAPAGSLAAEEIAAQAIRHIEAGELERARELIDRLLLGDRLALARAALAAGSPQDALTEIDRALTVAPSDPEVRMLKADASLRLAETLIQAGSGSGTLIQGALQDAIEFYRGADSAHALLGASRAAWLLSRGDEALAFAREGIARLAADDAGAGELGVAPERIHAEPAFAAYVRARSAAAEDAPSAEDVRALFLESEDALSRLLGRESTDPWAWRTLSDLYEWEGRLAEAKDTLERGLARAPEDAAMLERFARVSRTLDGGAATVAALEAYAAAHPSVAAARWHLAVARFQTALDGYKSDPPMLDPAPFAAAEAEFRATRERAPEYHQGALGYEVVCRLARGWCAFHSDDLDGAQREFLSMNDLFERGIEWSLPNELESGIRGLYFVADKRDAKDDKLGAGEVFETLRELQPQEPLWANNAGLFLRDAAVDIEYEGRGLCRAARGELKNAEALAELRERAGIRGLAPGSAEERAAFAKAADERCERAKALMERSWKAYESAAELAPDDVAIVNDAALLLVHYLHRDLERAEAMLRRSIELGGPQLEAKRAQLKDEASPERAAALESEIETLRIGWGDAHENLGVLLWAHKNDAAGALPVLEKSVEIGPTRPPVTNALLPQVRGERPRDVDQYLGWAKPCEIR